MKFDMPELGMPVFIAAVRDDGTVAAARYLVAHTSDRRIVLAPAGTAEVPEPMTKIGSKYVQPPRKLWDDFARTPREAMERMVAVLETQAHKIALQQAQVAAYLAGNAQPLAPDSEEHAILFGVPAGASGGQTHTSGDETVEEDEEIFV